MSFYDRLRGWFNQARQTQSYWPNRGTRIDYVQPTFAGIRVTPDTALQQATVWACVQTRSKSTAQLPWRLTRRTGPATSIACPGMLDDLLNHRPNPEMSAFTFRETMIGHVLTWGNAYAEIERYEGGRPIALWPIEPDRRVQCDEVWSFVHAKAKNAPTSKRAGDPTIGDCWTWTAIEAQNKLLLSYLVGGRDTEYALMLMADLRGRLANRVQLTTDVIPPRGRGSLRSGYRLFDVDQALRGAAVISGSSSPLQPV